MVSDVPPWVPQVGSTRVVSTVVAAVGVMARSWPPTLNCVAFPETGSTRTKVACAALGTTVARSANIAAAMWARGTTLQDRGLIFTPRAARPRCGLARLTVSPRDQVSGALLGPEVR